jgi:hypothetical protein
MHSIILEVFKTQLNPICYKISKSSANQWLEIKNDSKNQSINLPIQYNTIQYNAMQCHAIQYNTIQYNAMQCNTIQYNTIQYNTISLFLIRAHLRHIDSFT